MNWTGLFIGIMRFFSEVVREKRRWRAAKDAGLKEIPCIISEKENILEQQLRSDCLKEGLTVDELDRAIYRY
jgi:ParB-like chromosome segregation protein Spo0J